MVVLRTQDFPGLNREIAEAVSNDMGVRENPPAAPLTMAWHNPKASLETWLKRCLDTAKFVERPVSGYAMKKAEWQWQSVSGGSRRNVQRPVV
jgi:hypothetical protein